MKVISTSHLRVCVLLAAALLTPLVGHAGVWVQTGLSAIQSTHTDNDITSTETRALVTPTLGWSFLQGFILGAQGFFALNHGNNKTVGLGPKGGVLIEGFELTGAWLSYAKDIRNSDTRTGKGVAINLGYSAKVAGPLCLGAYASYFGLTFDKLNGASIAPYSKMSFISPQLALTFDF